MGRTVATNFLEFSILCLKYFLTFMPILIVSFVVILFFLLFHRVEILRILAISVPVLNSSGATYFN